jgi:hypothetical protein
MGSAMSAGGADARGLRVAPRSAVPGQVVVLAKVAAKRPQVRIGGRRARVVGRRRGRLRVVVPALPPGRAKVVVRDGKRRLDGRLRVRRGFSGRVRPILERGRAVSRSIGPEGGTVAATSAAGISFGSRSRLARCRGRRGSRSHRSSASAASLCTARASRLRSRPTGACCSSRRP